jgi:excisionase family DNA binding protein
MDKVNLITTGAAAKIAGVTRETIQNNIHRGLLQAQRTPGGHWRLDEGHVREKLCRPSLAAALA